MAPLWITRLRWKLARAVAPSPIISDPFPDVADGAIVSLRSHGSTYAALRASTFEMDSEATYGSFGAPALEAYSSTARVATFRGTVTE